MAAAYPLVLADKRKAGNAWGDSSFLRALEKLGFIVRKPAGSAIEIPVSYQSNQEGGVQGSDLDAVSLEKTDVITSLSYNFAIVREPIKWSLADEAKNEDQKIDLVENLTSNGIDSHDSHVESALFTTSTAGGDELLGFDTLIPTGGQGSAGGVDSATEVWNRCQTDTYTGGTDLLAGMTSVWNACARGGMSPSKPSLMVSDADTNALYESKLTPNQRYGPADKGNAGFDAVYFKNKPFTFSQAAPADNIYFLTPEAYQLVVAKGYFRQQGDVIPMVDRLGSITNIVSLMQACAGVRSRLGVLHK
jgi:hypothetical protein